MINWLNKHQFQMPPFSSFFTQVRKQNYPISQLLSQPGCAWCNSGQRDVSRSLWWGLLFPCNLPQNVGMLTGGVITVLRPWGQSQVLRVAGKEYFTVSLALASWLPSISNISGLLYCMRKWCPYSLKLLFSLNYYCTDIAIEHNP